MLICGVLIYDMVKYEGFAEWCGISVGGSAAWVWRMHLIFEMRFCISRLIRGLIRCLIRPLAQWPGGPVLRNLNIKLTIRLNLNIKVNTAFVRGQPLA